MKGYLFDLLTHKQVCYLSTDTLALQEQTCSFVASKAGRLLST